MPKLLTSKFTDCVLASEQGVKLGSLNFVPDSTKGFMRFQMAQAFPNQTKFGTAMMASVIEKSYQSLLYQPFDYEHQIAAYHKEEGKPNRVTDRILGSVVAAQFNNSSAWRISDSPENAPKIEAVACYAKLAQGMRSVLGEHSTGLHRWSVSMEIDYAWDDTGFALPRAGRKPLSEFAASTSPDMAAAGFDYVPTAEAPADLKATFSARSNRITSHYKGRKPTLVIGGLDGEVHFKGVALARYGAEDAAGIQSLAASNGGVIAFAFQPLIEMLRNSRRKDFSK